MGEGKEKNFEVSDLHSIRLSRYGYRPYPKPHRLEEQPAETSINRPEYNTSKSERFYLFDYFDELIHIADDNGSLTYKDCMGLDNPSLKDIINEYHKKQTGQYGPDLNDAGNKTGKSVLFPKNLSPTASQSWNLVRLKTDNITPNQDPFKYGSSKDHLSDKPFLAIITVTINPEHYYFWTKSHDPEKSSRDFIQECLESINNRINEFTEGKDMIIKVLMSVNYGDFCVIIRTEDIRDAYLLTYKFRNPDGENEQQNSIPRNGGKSDAYKIRFSTFTTVGMETGLSKDNVPLSIEDTQVKAMGNHYYVLRLLAHTSVLPKLNGYIVENKPDDNVLNEPLGILGRYDISIRLSLEQFNQIYPLLCHYKLKMGGPTKKIPRPEKNTFAYILDDEIRSGNIYVINERPLINIEYENKNADDGNKKSGNNVKDKYQKEYENIILGFIKKLNRLKYEIDNVAGMANMLPNNRKTFIELMRLIKELYKTYIPMWFQHDSRTNIYMIYMVLYTAVGVTKLYIDKINDLVTEERLSKTEKKRRDAIELDLATEERLSKTDEKRRNAIERLSATMIESLNMAVYQINSLAKIIQGINLQTIQMPNYEIQTQVDMEKYTVAFTEFLREFSASYYRQYHDDHRTRIMPFITLDLTEEKVGARRLFQAVISPEFNHVVSHTAELLNIIIPSFECLARAYDLLMLLCHEITHSFRFISREERNQYVIDMILERMSKYITNQLLTMSNPSRNFFNVSSVETLISGAIKEALAENCPLEEWDRYSLKYLESSIVEFFINNVFTDRDELISSNSVKSPVATITDALKFMYTKAQGIDDPEKPLALRIAFKNYSKLTRYIDEYAAIPLDSDQSGKLQKCIIPILKKSRKSTALEEFYQTHEFKKAVQIKICEIITLLPCFAEDEKKPDGLLEIKKELLDYLKSRLSEMKLYIDDNTVYMDPDFIRTINSDLKFYATKNQVYELTDFILPKDEDELSESLDEETDDLKVTHLSPYGLIKNALKKAIVDDRLRIPAETTIIELKTSVIGLYEKIRVLENNFSPDNVERFCNACSQVKQDLSSLTGDPVKAILDADEFNTLTALVKISEEKITAFAQTLCDISFHYQCVKLLTDNAAGVPICSDHIRKRIIKSIHSKLNAAYNKDINTDVYQTILMSSQIHTLLSALCISSDKRESFSENLRKCFYSFSADVIQSMVGGYIKLYNEIVSDFGMCAALALDAFGYLKFYVRYYHRLKRLENNYYQDARTERVAAVINTLLSAEDSNIKDADKLKPIELQKKRLDFLKPKVWDYIQHVFKSTEEDIKKDIKNAINDIENYPEFNSSWKKFKADLSKTKDEYLELLNPTGKKRKKIDVRYNCLTQRFRNRFKFLEKIVDKQTSVKCINLLINNYFERFDRLYYLLDLLSRISKYYISKDAEDHLKGLYFNNIKHKTGLYCVWDNASSETEVRQKVSNYFNSTEPYERKLSSSILKNTLAFILEYYYRNRLVFSKSSSFNKNWVINLTGGDFNGSSRNH